ncbi:MFS transporter [Pseudonocardiaceae bacterium YIM PH 21723]|nr:MFS transporter [Pseudonocardiaceae bacterium YIM PH 21723]
MERGRRHRVRGPAGQPGQDPGIPGGARRDRAGDPPGTGHHPGGAAGPRRRPRPTHRGVDRGQRRPHGAGRPAAPRAACGDGALGLLHRRRPARHGQRQDRPPGAAAPIGRAVNRAGFGFPSDRRAIPIGLAAFINALGTGVFYPFAVVFFSRQLHISLGRVGVGLGIGAAIALVAVAGAGRLVNLVGGRNIVVITVFVRCLARLSLIFVDSFGLFVCTVVADVACMRIGQMGEQAIAVGLGGAEQRGSWLALSRTAFNAGMGCGALLSGIAVALSGDSGVPLLLINAAGFALAGVLYLRVRGISGSETGRPPAGIPILADRLFVWICVINAVQWLLLMGVELALPAYLQGSTHAPLWTTSVLFAINTAMITLLQLPVSRRLRSFSRPDVIAVGCLLLAVSFALLIPIRHLGDGPLLAVLILMIVVFTAGEMLCFVELTAMVTQLAPEGKLGSYLATNQVALGISNVVAPMLLLAVLEFDHTLLWGALCGVSLVTGALMLRMRRALRPRLVVELART